MTYHFRDFDGDIVVEQHAADEPRIQDLLLARRLGFARPADIRELIARNEAELASYAEVFRTVRKTSVSVTAAKTSADVCVSAPQNDDLSCRTTNPSAKGGRPGKEFWLTEGQALVICALSRTPKAAAVRKLIIEVFMAWRREQEKRTVHVREHDRRPPARALPAKPKIAQSIALSPTADPNLMRFEAVVPNRMAYDWVGAFAAYQQTIVAGLTQQS